MHANEGEFCSPNTCRELVQWLKTETFKNLSRKRLRAVSREAFFNFTLVTSPKYLLWNHHSPRYSFASTSIPFDECVLIDLEAKDDFHSALLLYYSRLELSSSLARMRLRLALMAVTHYYRQLNSSCITHTMRGSHTTVTSSELLIPPGHNGFICWSSVN